MRPRLRPHIDLAKLELGWRRFPLSARCRRRTRCTSRPRLFELLVENKAQSPTTCNALIRRSLFARIGGFEDRFRGMFEDQAFFAKALLAAPTYVDRRIWAKYRQHEGSCSARSARAGADLAHRRRILKWMDEALAEALAPHPSARARLAEEIRSTRRLALRRGARRLLRRGSSSRPSPPRP